MATNEQQVDIIDFANRTRWIEIVLQNSLRFAIHDHLLANKSPYLRQCVDYADETSSLEFVRIHPGLCYCRDFNQYINWMIYGHFAVEPVAQTASPPLPLPSAGQKLARRQYTYLGQLYLLAASLQDTAFQDAVLDAFRATSRKPSIDGAKDVPADRVVNEIYKFTQSGSKARSLLVDIFVARAEDDDITKGDLHPDFMRDYAAKLTRKRRREPVPVDTCEYHVHDEDEECENRKRRRM